MLSGKTLGSKNVWAYNIVKGLCSLNISEANENIHVYHMVTGHQNDWFSGELTWPCCPTRKVTTTLFKFYYFNLDIKLQSTT